MRGIFFLERWQGIGIFSYFLLRIKNIPNERGKTMPKAMKKMRREGALFLTVLIVLIGSLFIYCAKKEEIYRVVIIKAAGYLPGTEPPTEPDAITQATSEGGNTHVFVDKLVERLSLLKAEAKVVNHLDCQNLDCIYHVDAKGEKEPSDLTVFAGPTYGSKLPQQLLKFVPTIKETEYKGIVTALTSAHTPSTGVIAMKHFDSLMAEVKIRTFPGLVLGSEIRSEDLDKKVQDFAVRVLGELENPKK